MFANPVYCRCAHEAVWCSQCSSSPQYLCMGCAQDHLKKCLSDNSCLTRVKSRSAIIASTVESIPSIKENIARIRCWLQRMDREYVTLDREMAEVESAVRSNLARYNLPDREEMTVCYGHHIPDSVYCEFLSDRMEKLWNVSDNSPSPLNDLLSLISRNQCVECRENLEILQRRTPELRLEELPAEETVFSEYEEYSE